MYRSGKASEYKIVSMLYIYTRYEETVSSPWGKWVIIHEKNIRFRVPTIWGANWDYFSIADLVVITLNSSSYYILKVFIITEVDKKIEKGV